MRSVWELERGVRSGPGYKVHSTLTRNWVVRWCRLAELLQQVQRSRCDGCCSISCSRKTSITSLIWTICTFITRLVCMCLMHRFYSKAEHRNEVSVRLEIPQRGWFYGTMLRFCSAAKHLSHPLILHLTPSQSCSRVYFTWRSLICYQSRWIWSSQTCRSIRERLFCFVTSDRYLHISQQETLIVQNVSIDLRPNFQLPKRFYQTKDLTAQPEFSPVEQHDIQMVKRLVCAQG